ncbi:HNH endonuclease [Streptomyces smyrnaeus]|uniref:HNH endonuclease n=1 Tax=Streptomyces smyrnaeus TaxID=1387713 RepID=UPI0037A3B0B3
MGAKRPAIPRELRRRILIEAGHRCAIPTCRATPVEIAHIDPWSKVKRHDFVNLIALCPTCHTRFDDPHGAIDRKAMRQYKANLSPLSNGFKARHPKHVKVIAGYQVFWAFLNHCIQENRALEKALLDPTTPDSAMEALEYKSVASREEALIATLDFDSLYTPKRAGEIADNIFKVVDSWYDELWSDIASPAAPRKIMEEIEDLALALMEEIHHIVNECAHGQECGSSCGACV